jgi:hypothetical protein
MGERARSLAESTLWSARIHVPVTGAIGGAESMPLTAEDWKEWPVLPAHISEEMRRLYQVGLRKGTDPTAFSIIGDCQSQPEEFLGIFDTDPRSLSNLPAPLHETARHFAGNFGRYSPTIRDGITAGAVLWNEWANNYHRGQVCKANENPLSCELRVNNPSIVFIHIGTHWEARNHRYLTLIVEMIKEHGAVPVMVTKADNREGDERINYQTVQVAEELGVPVWNFWASVQHTPNNGLEDNSAMYLNARSCRDPSLFSAAGVGSGLEGGEVGRQLAVHSSSVRSWQLAVKRVSSGERHLRELPLQHLPHQAGSTVLSNSTSLICKASSRKDDVCFLITS